MRDLERAHPTTPSARALAADSSVLAIVGMGRVGGSFAAAAERAGLTILTVGRDDLTSVAEADAALLCVPDSEIATAAGALTPAIGRLRLVGHTSGATNLGALAAVAEAGAEVFSL